MWFCQLQRNQENQKENYVIVGSARSGQKSQSAPVCVRPGGEGSTGIRCWVVNGVCSPLLSSLAGWINWFCMHSKHSEAPSGVSSVAALQLVATGKLRVRFWIFIMPVSSNFKTSTHWFSYPDDYEWICCMEKKCQSTLIIPNGFFKNDALCTTAPKSSLHFQLL